VSENRNQTSEGGRKGRRFYGEDGGLFPVSEGSDRTAELRKAGWRPFSLGIWERSGEFRRIEDLLNEQQTWAEKHDDDVLAKNRNDLSSDANEATLPDREKSATVAQVSRVEQSRAKGQRFRSDARPATVRISTEMRSGDDGHEFLDSPGDWNAKRQL
jgi:hypothetical protein